MDEIPSPALSDFDSSESNFTASSPGKRLDRETYKEFAVASTDGGRTQYMDERGRWFALLKYAKLFGTKAEANVAARDSGGEVIRVKMELVAERL